MTPAYIALGSNLARPERQLRDAVSALGRLPASRLDRLSGMYRSRAVGPPGQPDYLNAVALLLTELSPHGLLDELQAIEARQGRERGERWGPRTLDLDLLLYGDTRLQDARLTLPHPRMHERDFVLLPLGEISDTSITLPGGGTIEALLQNCLDTGLIRVGDLAGADSSLPTRG